MTRAYDLPLTDWIRIGLHRDSLKSAVEAVQNDRRLDSVLNGRPCNKAYIEKILREEVVKQFKDSKRPMLEVILNAVDARPASNNEDYTINVKVGRSKFAAKDNGDSMSLEQILRLLIIPFATEKEGIETIGRFGVGFLSTFNYCIRQPDTLVMVDTSTGSESYRIVFYATEKDKISSLRMRVKRRRPGKQQGTTVTIKRKLFDKHDTGEYLTGHLRGVPSYLANLVINGIQINADKKVKWYAWPVELEARGRKLRQRVAVKIGEKLEGRYGQEYSGICLTSQGVLVKSFGPGFSNMNATVAFPPAVHVVEGRDEFKIDENYKKCVEGAFKALELYIKEQPRSKESILTLSDFVPALMAAFEIKHIKDVPNIDSIARTLFGEKKYALTHGQHAKFRPFFGKKLDEVAFEASHSGCAYWRDIYGSGENLLKEMPKSAVKFDSMKAFVEKARGAPDFAPNLQLFSDVIAFDDHIDVTLLELEHSGESPVIVYDGHLYINVSHPVVAGERSPLKVYSLLSEYFSLPEVREKVRLHDVDDVERKVLLYACDYNEKRWAMTSYGGGMKTPNAAR